MEYIYSVKKYKTPTDANWVTSIPAGTDYAKIKVRVYDFSKVKDGAPNSTKDGNGYWKASAEATGLINPFTNPITNTVVTETKITITRLLRTR